MSLWTINPKQIEDLAGGDGSAFRDFMNKVIRAQCSILGMPIAEIATDFTTSKDGGVDCEVTGSSSNDTSGWLQVKSCWQYKGTKHTSITAANLKKEVNKKYCKELIKKGYGYRLCIADSLTAQKKAGFEDVLTKAIKAINPNAPSPMVLTTTSICTWASKFPAIAAHYLQTDEFLDILAWKKPITGLTKKYVPVAIWKTIADEIAAHANFTKSCRNIVYPVHADAGIGKTRLTYEVLSQIPDACELVIYTSDEDAGSRLASLLSKHQDVYAVLVVDECSLEKRLEMQNALAGSESHIRIVTISNHFRTSYKQEPSLSKMPDDVVDQILKENFPDISAEQRRMAVALSGGFVKIAADICKSGLSGNLHEVEEYYQTRIRGDEFRKVIEAISLVKKVGFNGDVSHQFDDLCKLTGLNPEEAKRKAKQLKDAPGFVVIGGRYFYVTPEAIAQVALRNAWNHWVADNPADFFDKVPQSLIDEMHKRIASSGSSEFRDSAARYYSRFSDLLTPDDLADKKKLDRLIALVETDPSKFLPTLTNLIETSTPSQLQNGGSQSKRRNLVWLCERLSSFSEYFYDVEKILWVLASNETEKGIGNNATGVWKHLFSILLSGTNLPYLDRLNVLESRFSSATPNQIDIAIDALASIFSNSAFRMVGPAVVAGRIPPPDWHPSDRAEYLACYQGAFSLMERFISNNSFPRKTELTEKIVQHTFWFLSKGFLAELCDLLRKPRIQTSMIPKIIEGIELFKRSAQKTEPKETIPQKYLIDLEKWHTALTPDDVHSRVVATIGRRGYLFRGEDGENELKKQISSLAQELGANLNILTQEIPWLTSNAAEGAFELGKELGEKDTQAALLDLILSREGRGHAISRGYFLGLAKTYPEYVSRLNHFLDDLEAANPTLVLDYATTIPLEMYAFDRWIRLYDSGKVPASYIRNLSFSLGRNEIHTDLLKKALSRLARAKALSEHNAAEATLALIFSWIEAQNQRKGDFADSDKPLWNSITRILSKVDLTDVMAAYYWEESMKVFSKISPEKAIKIAAAKLSDDDFSTQEAGQRILVKMVESHPKAVLEAIGKQLSDSRHGWKIRMRGCGWLFLMLPAETVTEWLEIAGLNGARLIASSLPWPHLDNDKKPIVPKVTDAVLKIFGHDNKVLQGFVCGSGIRSYFGDIESQKREEAKVAEMFLNHPVAAIREWARVEKLGAEREAERHRIEEEESEI